MQVVLAVAAGGAIGAVSRYALASGITNLFDLRGSGTFAVNLVGAFLLGAIVGLTEERWDLSEPVRTGIVVGVLGGFTTFSTYMYDVVAYGEDERLLASSALLVLTIGLGLIAMVGGLAVGRAG